MANAAKLATAKASVTVNAAFLQEIKEVNEDLWRLLADTRDACDQAVAGRCELRAFVTQFGCLRDQLAMHFALEEAFGYFDDPVVVAPRLSQRATALRGQHARLYVMIRNIADHAEQLLYGGSRDGIIGHLARRFHAFYDELREHESRENKLIFEAFNDDIGVGD